MKRAGGASQRRSSNRPRSFGVEARRWRVSAPKLQTGGGGRDSAVTFWSIGEKPCGLDALRFGDQRYGSHVGVLPMFPLGNVLVPGGVLQLHVFEPRYQALVKDCVAADDHHFGVVLIDRGHEVGGGDVRRTVGTIAQMLQVAEMEDGRYAVIAIGVGRMRVNAWLPDDPYPVADVDEWPDVDDTDQDSDELLQAVTKRARRAAALSLELGDEGSDPGGDLADELLTASYQLIDLAPLGPADAYDLLCAAGPLARLKTLDELLVGVEAINAFRLQNP